jgi:hypothetical protein
MFTDEDMAHQFRLIIDRLYPSVGALLSQCHIRLLTTYSKQVGAEWQYIGIYCPREVLPKLKVHQRVLRDAARHLGLVEAVCLNATALVNDPRSPIPQNDPSLWLELNWLASTPASTPES